MSIFSWAGGEVEEDEKMGQVPLGAGGAGVCVCLGPRIPVTGLSLRRTEDGLRMSARNL